MDCNNSNIEKGVNSCAKPINGLKSVYFDPRTDKVYADEDMKVFLGYGIMENDKLHITWI